MEEELYGGAGTRSTVAAREVNNQYQLGRRGLDLEEGGLMGTYGGRDTLGRSAYNLSEEELISGLTGRFRGDETMESRTLSRQNELDRIAQIMAAGEAKIPGFESPEVGQMLRDLLQMPPPPKPSATGFMSDADLNDLLESLPSLSYEDREKFTRRLRMRG